MNAANCAAKSAMLQNAPELEKSSKWLITRFLKKTAPKSEFCVRIARLKLLLGEAVLEIEELEDIQNSPFPTQAKPKSSGYSMGIKT
jgi:hypothetical protein